MIHIRGSPDPCIRRSEVTQLYEATIQVASDITEAIRERALHEPGLVPRIALLRSVKVLVFRINEILRYGPLVGGAELAWKATLHQAECCIVALDSPLEVNGEEPDCGDHHDRLDRRMVSIAKLQQKCGKVSANRSQGSKNTLTYKREGLLGQCRAHERGWTTEAARKRPISLSFGLEVLRAISVRQREA